MSIEALIDKTASRLQLLVAFIAVPGVLLLGVGLVMGAMAIAGGGVAFLFGGFLAWRRVRSNRDAMHALAKDPSQVAQIVPIVQTVQGGIITHYPVVLVTVDGRQFRIATWARSVEEAVAPFRARFPHAKGLTDDSGFAPDDGFAVRFKMIGLMFLSIAVGVLFAVLFSLPKTFSEMSRFDRAYELQVAKNEAMTSALKAVASDDVQGRWSDCSLESLGEGVDVRITGAAESTRDRTGTLRRSTALTLRDGYELMVYRTEMSDVLFRAMMGGRSYSTNKVQDVEVAVVGARRGDQLHARLVELPSGKVLCEGTGPANTNGKATSTSEDEVLAGAVMRPFCSMVSCPTRAPETEAPAAPVQPTATKPKPPAKTTPVKPSEPVAGALDANSIRSVVRASNARTRICYERALAKQPSLQGTLTVSFTIGRDGKVSSSMGSGFPNQGVTDCVVKVFQGLRFPASSDGKVTPVKYPIVFRPS